MQSEIPARKGDASLSIHQECPAEGRVGAANFLDIADVG